MKKKVEDETVQIRICTGVVDQVDRIILIIYAQLSVNEFTIHIHKLNKGIDHTVILNLYTRWRWWMCDDAKYNNI